MAGAADQLAALFQVSAGGSLSNTLIGLSRLGQADNCLRGSGGLQVALAGAVGSDTLGSFFAAQAAKAGVAILADTVPDSSTGTADNSAASSLLPDQSHCLLMCKESLLYIAVHTLLACAHVGPTLLAQKFSLIKSSVLLQSALQPSLLISI